MICCGKLFFQISLFYYFFFISIDYFWSQITFNVHNPIPPFPIQPSKGTGRHCECRPLLSTRHLCHLFSCLYACIRVESCYQRELFGVNRWFNINHCIDVYLLLLFGNGYKQFERYRWHFLWISLVSITIGATATIHFVDSSCTGEVSHDWS